jgi:hypothetical protein
MYRTNNPILYQTAMDFSRELENLMQMLKRYFGRMSEKNDYEV